MLYRLLAVTAAGMYAVAALHAPEDIQPLGAATASTAEADKDSPGAPGSEAVEVSRSAFAALGFTLGGAPAREAAQDGPSEREAIEIALERGRAAREAREAGQSGIVPASVSIEVAPVVSRVEDESAPVDSVAVTPLWTVTGSTVNLRAGPGTNHSVVGQVKAGEMARPLGDTGGDWIEIEVPATGANAFIFARFLEPAQG